MLNEILDKNGLQPMEPIPTALQPSGRIYSHLHCRRFDVYGTLLISGSGDVGTAMQAVQDDARLKELLLTFNIDRSPARVLDDFFSAIADHHSRLKASGIDYPEVNIDRIWMQVLGLPCRHTARAFALAFELIANPVYPMPGLRQLMQKGRECCCLGIISNAQFYTPLLLERCLDASLENTGFAKDLLIFSYQMEYAKPSDHLFQVAESRLEKRGILPSATLYVGNDMLNDILPAQRIGFKTALFAGDKRSLRLRPDDARCEDIVPDIIVTDLLQLVEYL